jgi:hypothetical protein
MKQRRAITVKLGDLRRDVILRCHFVLRCVRLVKDALKPRPEHWE